MTRKIVLGLLLVGTGCVNDPVVDDGSGAGGAGGSGGTTTTTTPTTTTTTTTTGMGPEDCTNGVDDDADEDVDCEDADCESHVCVDVPLGWEGPVVLGPEDCGGDFPTLHAELLEVSGAPATCGCACGAAAGSTCSGPVVTLYNVSGCGGGGGTVVLSSTCTSEPPHSSSSAIDGTPSGGSCPPLPTVDVPMATTTNFSVCQRTFGGGCGEGKCSPVPQDPFLEQLCIFDMGDVACPDNTFPDRRVLHVSVDDQRGCTTCTCGAPSASCASTVHYHNQGDSSCTSQTGSYSAGDGGCHANITGNYWKSTNVVTQGSCTPGATTPTGDFVGTGTITVCCTSPL